MMNHRIYRSALLLAGFAVQAGMQGDRAAAAAEEQQSRESKPVAGKADVLRHVPKKFAMFLETDTETGKVRLQLDGDEQPSLWAVNPDAEIKVRGWWGRLQQFARGDRVWVWFDIDRKKMPVSILMLADEVSERDIHGTAKPDEIEPLREEQREYLRHVWRKEGLPGTVSVLHKLGGEMDLLLDHEAIRWGRYLKNGDEVTLRTAEPVKARVKHVSPWRERTVVRLVTGSGLDQADLSVGQRVQLLVPEPPQEIQRSHLPTDLGRERSKEERIEWFLCSVYCTCQIAGDRCTGMFYVQASCNVNGCGMPKRIRDEVARLIDEGRPDRAILEHLLKTRGPELLKPHLLK